MRLGGLQDPGNRTSRRESKAQSPAETTSYLKIDPTLIQRTGLSVEQLQELIEIFQLVDVDNGGTISTDELEMLMKTLGLRATQTELKAMVTELDQDGTGEIDFESFVGAMTKKVQTSITAQDLEQAFKLFSIYDDDNKLVADASAQQGVLPTSTVLSILSKWGDVEKRLTTSEAEEIIAQVGPHGCINGTFDFKQFIAMYLT